MLGCIHFHHSPFLYKGCCFSRFFGQLWKIYAFKRYRRTRLDWPESGIVGKAVIYIYKIFFFNNAGNKNICFPCFTNVQIPHAVTSWYDTAWEKGDFALPFYKFNFNALTHLTDKIWNLEHEMVTWCVLSSRGLKDSPQSASLLPCILLQVFIWHSMIFKIKIKIGPLKICKSQQGTVSTTSLRERRLIIFTV
jgi:hypothetical protein